MCPSVFYYTILIYTIFNLIQFTRLFSLLIILTDWLNYVEMVDFIQYIGCNRSHKINGNNSTNYSLRNIYSNLLFHNHFITYN